MLPRVRGLRYNADMLENILGTPTAAAIMLHLIHFGEVHARDLAKDLDVTLSDMQEQLETYEESEVLISSKSGTTRRYVFNKKSPYTRPLMDLIRVQYNSMSEAEKEQYFQPRVAARRGSKAAGRSRAGEN